MILNMLNTSVNSRSLTDCEQLGVHEVKHGTEDESIRTADVEKHDKSNRQVQQESTAMHNPQVNLFVGHNIPDI